MVVAIDCCCEKLLIEVEGVGHGVAEMGCEGIIGHWKQGWQWALGSSAASWPRQSLDERWLSWALSVDHSNFRASLADASHVLHRGYGFERGGAARAAGSAFASV